MEYIHKWEGWKNEIVPRTISWSERKKGKSWQVCMTVTDEHGTPIKYTRWGKNKKTTRKFLARMAWYRYLENTSSPSVDFDEIPLTTVPVDESSVL